MIVDVVIPALDEEGPLARVLAALPRPGGAVPGAGAFTLRRIVVADNGSTDRTADVARAAGAEVVHEPRRGYGAACLAALAHLAGEPPDAVVFLDADDSDDPRELPVVLAPLASGSIDLCVGARVAARRERGAFTPAQALGNRLAPALMRALWGAHATDLGPFRAIRWHALVRLGLRDRDYGWTVEMQARAFALGMRVVEVPVSYRRRRLGRSKVSGTLRGVWGAATKIVWTIARVRWGAAPVVTALAPPYARARREDACSSRNTSRS